jgi:hypothetical protein
MHAQGHNMENFPHVGDIFQFIHLEDGIELQIPLIAGADNDSWEEGYRTWEESPGSDPNAEGRHYPENGFDADKHIDYSDNDTPCVSNSDSSHSPPENTSGFVDYNTTNNTSDDDHLTSS